MDERLQDLYHVPEQMQPENVYLQALSEQSSRLEQQLRSRLADLPQDVRYLVEAYMDIRDELEFQSVKVALHVGNKYLHTEK